jgi:outer membrane protein insertion porin family
MTREERWYRFLSSADTYDPDRLTYDKELLRRFYLKHGFADFRVTSAVAELTPDRQGFFITFTIDEGHRYKFGKSSIKASLRNVKVSSLKPLITSESGDWYNADQVEKIVQHMTDALGNQGFAFVNVQPELKRDRKTHVVNVVYNIRQGPRVYVDRIEITGNTRTLDKVIRREFTLVEGDAFNTAKLRRSQQRIRDLNFFSKVDVTNVPSETAPDRTVIKVHVQEKSTGDLSLGVGWSTIAGPLAQVSMHERNLLGRGQDLLVSAGLGTRQTNYNLSFTEPYFMDRRLSAGFDLFDLQRRLQIQSGYDSNSLGMDLRAGYYLSEHLSQSVKYLIREDQVQNVASGASRYIQEQAGTATMSSVQQTLFYDRRDSKIDPTEGYYLRLDNEIAGLGGSEDFLRNDVGGGQFFPIADKVILSVSANAGIISGFASKPVRITQRYFLGGNTVRGFADAGISPRDATTGDALGGLWQYYGSAQVKFPLGLPEEYGIAGEAFTDFGATGQTDTSEGSAGIQYSSSPRVAVGVGMTWKSPMGPIAVDLGFPIVKQSFDKTQLFRFNFGTRF